MTVDGTHTRPELTWEAVTSAFRGANSDRLVALFAGRTTAERRALVPRIKEEVSRLSGTWDQHADRQAAVVLAAGAACLGGPAAIAQLLSRRGFPWQSRRHDPRTVYALLAERDPAWTADVAARLDARLTTDPWNGAWELVDFLTHRGDVPAARSDAYVLGWVRRGGGEATYAPGETFAEHLTRDEHLGVLLPRIFEAPGVGALIDAHDTRRTGDDVTLRWGGALAVVAHSGVIDRDTLLDGCLSRLLRGERLASLRGFVRLHTDLAPSEDELAARTTDYVRLLPDAPGPVAALAQDTLRGLDTAGRLDAEHIVEASRAVLFRAEKKLVRSQLTWIGQAVKRHPAHAGELLASATTAFGAEATDLQERALTLIGRHLPALPAAQADLVRAEVLAALPSLGDAVRPDAAALVGAAGEAEEETYQAPPLPPPVRELPPPIASLDELVEEIAAFFADVANPWSGSRGGTDPIALERIVAALLRESDRDRAALGAALLPIADRRGDVIDQDWYAHQALGAVGAMVGAVTRTGSGTSGWFRSLFGGKSGGRDVIPAGRRGVLAIAGPQHFLLARLYEVAQRLRVPNSGPHLAGIVTATGFVDPEALVAGLETYEATGRGPWRRDLEQALLRLPMDPHEHLAERAAKLASPAGRRVARVLAAGGPALGRVERGFHADIDRTVIWRPLDAKPIGGPLASVSPGDAELDECALPLYELADPLVGAQHARDAWETRPDVRCWALVAPRDRDVIAAHVALRAIHAVNADYRGAEVLPALAEAEGPVGPGMSIALAYALGAEAAEDRMSATDAIVTLAARPEPWQPAALGVDLGRAVSHRGVKPTRVLPALADAARAGAHEAVWGVLTGYLPTLLARDKPTGLADTLALAAETAARSGAREVSVRGLDALADRKGSSRAAGEARRLRKVLAGREG